MEHKEDNIQTPVEPVVNQYWSVNLASLPVIMSDLEALVNPITHDTAEIFWRPIFEKYRLKLRNIADGREIVPVNEVFTGPVGAGKSCMLYALAQYASRAGFLVLYLPQCTMLCNLSPKMLARAIIENLRNCNPHWPNNKFSLSVDNDENIMQVAQDAVEFLRFGGHNACVVLDQWNCVKDPSTTPYFRNMFGTFNQIRVAKGAAFVAVSSSFPWVQDLFSDADAITHRQDVPLLSESEFSAILRHMISDGRLPEFSAESAQELCRLCGRVGRVLYFASKAWEASQPTGRTEWMPVDTALTMDYASMYYLARVQSLLVTAMRSGNSSEKEALVLFTTKLFLNKYTTTDLQEMPEAFRWVGLYDCSTFPPSPVSPAVTMAINRALADTGRELIQVLSERSSTLRGTALELFVEAAFRRGDFPKYIAAECTDLRGENPQVVEWQIFDVRIQDKVHPGACLENIVNGTLIICHEGHTVADMVLYCNLSVYFFQISILPYTKHTTKIDGLVLSNVLTTEESVGKFYTSRAPKSWNIPTFNGKFTNKIQEKVKYIYCTPNTTSHEINDRSKHVLRIGGSALVAFGSNYDMFLN